MNSPMELQGFNLVVSFVVTKEERKTVAGGDE